MLWSQGLNGSISTVSLPKGLGDELTPLTFSLPALSITPNDPFPWMLLKGVSHTREAENGIRPLFSPMSLLAIAVL